jgi:hypothetical protein
VFPSSAVREAVTDNMAGAQIRYDGHNRKKKTQTEEKRTANKGVLCYQRFENISDGYFNESQDKMDNAGEAGKVGLKVALDGRFDDRIYSSSSSPSPPLPAFLF